MNRWLKLKLTQHRVRKPVIEFGDRIAELNPDLLEPPSNHGDYGPINSMAQLAGLALLGFVIGLMILTVLVIFGCPPKARAAEYRIEAGPGQDGATVLTSAIGFRPGLAPWLRLDLYGAGIMRDSEWNQGIGADLVVGTPTGTPWAELGIGQAYFPNASPRIDGSRWWHIVGRWRWNQLSLGIHHLSNGRNCSAVPDDGSRCMNIGENFLALGWTW